ncbi:MAG: hypothetical protein P8X63_07830 [Desulfuromonadaceae bacterium]
MATLEELRNRVSNNLQDTDRIPDDLITQALNEGLAFCAREVRFPGLESEGTVSTVPGANRVAIPVDWAYQRGLYAVEVAGEDRVEIASSLAILRMANSEFGTGEFEGPVHTVAVSNGYLYYFRTPAEAVELLCRFDRSPDKLVRDSDVPEGIPEELAGVLLESFALWRLYPLIENGLEGPQANTLYFKTLFDEYLKNLDSFISEGQSSPEPIRDDTWRI